MDNQNFDFGSGRPEDRDRDGADTPWRSERPRDDGDHDRIPPKPFPMIVMIAGLVWLAVGAIGVLGNLVGMAAAGANPNARAGSGGNCCGLLFATAFLSCGFNTVKGTATDTRGNSVGSILFGMLQLLAAAFLAFGGFANAPQRAPVAQEAMILAVFVGLMGGSLILAGILGIAGRSGYLEWREQAHPKPRKRPRRDELGDRYER